MPRVIMFTPFDHLHIDSLCKYLQPGQRTRLNFPPIWVNKSSVWREFCSWPPKLPLFSLHKNGDGSNTIRNVSGTRTQRHNVRTFLSCWCAPWSRWTGITRRTLPETFRLTRVNRCCLNQACVCVCVMCVTNKSVLWNVIAHFEICFTKHIAKVWLVYLNQTPDWVSTGQLGFLKYNALAALWLPPPLRASEGWPVSALAPFIRQWNGSVGSPPSCFVFYPGILAVQRWWMCHWGRICLGFNNQKTLVCPVPASHPPPPPPPPLSRLSNPPAKLFPRLYDLPAGEKKKKN